MALGAAATTTKGFWSTWSYNANNVGAISRKKQRAPTTENSTGEQLLPQFENEKEAIESTTKFKARSGVRELNDSSTGNFFTAEIVAEHNTVDDCWIIINDKVYDVTQFGKDHPGGPVIFTQAGRDGTDYFRVFHSAKAWTYLQEYYIGDLKNVEPMSDVLSEYRELRRVLLKAQLFKSSKFYYFYKSLGNLAILAASLWIISAYDSFLSVLSSAFLLGLFWQQCGWLSHDFLHHQVTEDRWLNTMIGGLFWGNFMQGYSVGWWKTKHNVHHAATNECDEKFNPVDPDIDTVPLLAWSKDILATVDNEFFRSIIRIQHILFFPLLFLARFSWLHSSWEHARLYDMSKAMRILERGCLVLHYVALVAIAFSCLPVRMAISWLFLSQLSCGGLLSIVFVLSHNGMDVYNDPRDFVRAQVTSTRNIEGNFFNDWFTGGLNRQIEHHLFPTLPRHNLKKVAPYVKALCQKHGIHYEELSLWTGICRVFMRLVEVAQAV
ncbi:unnamed protein product [Calypogeia fissa]